jgi:hypothetical protein
MLAFEQPESTYSIRLAAISRETSNRRVTASRAVYAKLCEGPDKEARRVRRRPGWDHCCSINAAGLGSSLSRSHECERCTHECVRHDMIGVRDGLWPG